MVNAQNTPSCCGTLHFITELGKIYLFKLARLQFQLFGPSFIYFASKWYLKFTILLYDVMRIMLTLLLFQLLHEGFVQGYHRRLDM